MSTSYPFLAIARKHNVDYGNVLSYADTIMDDRVRPGFLQSLSFWQRKAFRELPLAAANDIAAKCLEISGIRS